jgi:plastocyanin
VELRPTLPIAALAAVLLLAACDTDEAPDGAPDDAAAEVDIVDSAFQPPEVEVTVGDTVLWTHTGNVAHTVTFDDGPDSGTINSGDTFSRTFDDAGEFDYVCVIHPGMAGIVVVSE